MAEMTSTDVVYYAQKLQSLLLAHDNAAKQVNFLDDQLTRLDRQLFLSTLDDAHSLVLHLLTRKSIIQGVRRMFDQYRSTKNRQVQELSALVLTSLGGDPDLEMPATSGRTVETDELARMSTTNYSILWRGV
ncbi:uncharacterized protein LOC117322063 isoform X1 [Pecten maximus]|uniref:uncharacterized protein LOC117322061 n=1 Tax=Pecten maximus TaxID=6579 RepID=UPI001458BBD5|nr:uncharacterized protein LOC117322061 [Pecten maximus]XP_033732684.1 uncharacterized protein LOC117322062 [Pecten maximus]XP_033732685.1 uncharacterized protein LOC117322063 isoform X1 [Pecten maximus]